MITTLKKLRCCCTSLYRADAVRYGMMMMMLVVGLFSTAQPAGAQQVPSGLSSQACIKEKTGLNNPSCTANDVRIGSFTLIAGPSTCDPTSNTPITVTLQANIESGPARYDVGLWINQAGGSARSDTTGSNCYRDYLPPPLSAASCNEQGGPYFDGDADTCGDVYAVGTNPCGNAVTGPCSAGGGTCLFTTRTFTVSILCRDSNGDGSADVGSCTSWDNNTTGVCTSILGTDPGTGSKCNCGTTNIIGLHTGCSVDGDCDDSNACTTDTCVLSQGGTVGTCAHQTISCDDSNACTTDACDPATGCTHTAISCDDGNACTTDACDPATGCTHTAISCDDGNACTTDGCDPASGCTHTAISCDDGNACTTDGCNPASGCTHTAVDCNDGNACTTDGCNPASGCTHTAVDCNDGNACTADSCIPASGCAHTAISCDDGDACTTDSCNPASGCVHTAVNCDDGDACTADSCNSSTGACVHTPICQTDTQIAPTATTCSDYTSGTAADLNELLYGTRGGAINSVSPGVFFLYDGEHLTATGTITVTESDGPWTQVIVPRIGQVILYDLNCNKLNVGTVSIDPVTGNVTITGVPAGDYILGIKYDPTTLKGYTPPTASTTYSFSVTTGGGPPGNSGSDSINVNPKP